ncbi:hypothetical protein E2562_024715 [Oryza meyeriana var. granulata]|uniref:Uncharacterized protein n=1 Tax=Oryza meyeriana var. granulata TaxID=110450 RepID=A0A6G1D7A7_9ORYZ|nr:hypothetical protein E2562_024715 [Oryza meyeriana var. granulata]
MVAVAISSRLPLQSRRRLVVVAVAVTDRRGVRIYRYRGPPWPSWIWHRRPSLPLCCYYQIRRPPLPQASPFAAAATGYTA